MYRKRLALNAAVVVLRLVLFLSGCAAGQSIRMTAEETAAYAPFAPPREVRILTINAWSGLTYEGVVSMGEHDNDPIKTARWELSPRSRPWPSSAFPHPAISAPATA